MTDLNKMTKPAINALLAAPLSASKLKKTSKADLIIMFDAMPATDALNADLRDARSGDDDPLPPKARKARVLEDRVLLEPGKLDDVRPTKTGSKRAMLVQALQRGATIEHMMELLGWNRATVSSALHLDVKAIGLGVERKAGKYFLLLPKGMKRLPLRDASTTRAEALVSACK